MRASLAFAPLSCAWLAILAGCSDSLPTSPQRPIVPPSSVVKPNQTQLIYVGCGPEGCFTFTIETFQTQVTLTVTNTSGAPTGDPNARLVGINFFQLGAAPIPKVVEGSITMVGPTSVNNRYMPPAWTLQNSKGGGPPGLAFTLGINGNNGAIASSCATDLPGGSNNYWMTPACPGGIGVIGPSTVVITFRTVTPWDGFANPSVQLKTGTAG
jgi:hypothetical protein